MKEANAAIIDTTLIEIAARPGTHVEAPSEERVENEAPYGSKKAVRAR